MGSLLLSSSARLVCLASALAVAGGWASSAIGQTRAAPQVASSSTVAPDAASTPLRIDSDYRLGAGDKVRIMVFGEESLSGEFFVSGSGRISFPLIGTLEIGGKTLAELQALITTRLADGYLKDPRVSAEVLNYRPFFILGEVNKPGEYPYTNGLTVLNAVATAQGFTYRANTRRVMIKHAGDEAERASSLSSGTRVEPGDTIRITERHF